MNRGIVHLAGQHLLFHRVPAIVLMVCLAVPLFVPVTTSHLLVRYQTALTARADATALLAGRKGSRFDLALAALWFRPADLEPLTMQHVEQLLDVDGVLAVPLRLGFTARGRAIVGTTPEYYELRGLRCTDGTIPLQLGEATLGATVADELGIGRGDTVFSDPPQLYELTAPPALKLHIVGVLDPTGGPEDHAVFVDIATTWVLDGVVHGHDPPASIADDKVLGRSDEVVVFSGAVLEYQEVTPDNIGSFHDHARPQDLAVTAIVIRPRDAKTRTLLKARWNVSTTDQIVVPREVVDDLMAFVFRIKTLVDVVALVLGACTLLMTAVVATLSLRLRRREIETLHRIGCARSTVAALCALELGAIFGGAALLATAGFTVAVALLPDLIQAL